jgi:hypothetical protein
MEALMLKRPYDGAETLNDAQGEAIICRDPYIAAWLEKLINATGGLVSSIESANQFRITRSEIEAARVWRAYPQAEEE